MVLLIYIYKYHDNVSSACKACIWNLLLISDHLNIDFQIYVNIFVSASIKHLHALCGTILFVRGNMKFLF